MKREILFHRKRKDNGNIYDTPELLEVGEEE